MNLSWISKPRTYSIVISIMFFEHKLSCLEIICFLLFNIISKTYSDIKNVSAVRSWTISKWTANVVAHVKRHRYTLTSSLPCCTYKAPVKSTPVNVNGCTSCVLSWGGLPIILLHITQLRRMDFTWSPFFVTEEWTSQTAKKLQVTAWRLSSKYSKNSKPYYT